MGIQFCSKSPVISCQCSGKKIRLRHYKTNLSIQPCSISISTEQQSKSLLSLLPVPSHSAFKDIAGLTLEKQRPIITMTILFKWIIGLKRFSTSLTS
jgi:hypothetical protein